MGRHALVVGGTGMLRGVCLWLAERGWDVSVVARRHARLASLAAEGGRGVWPVPADYGDDGGFAAALRAAVAARGPVEAAVCWIHSDAPRAGEVVADVVGNERRPARYFDVVGCEAADPSGATVPEAVFRRARGIVYRRIVLGFVVEGAASRWLRDEEIAGGVIGAIDRDEEEAVVGVVRPWEKRPAW